LNPPDVYPVFHYTDTLRLPWIVESGELRPTLNHLRGIGAVASKQKPPEGGLSAHLIGLESQPTRNAVF